MSMYLTGTTALAAATIGLGAAGWQVDQYLTTSGTYGIATRADSSGDIVDAVLILAKARYHVSDSLSNGIIPSEIQRTRDLAKRLRLRPALAHLAAAPGESSLLFVLNLDDLEAAADEPAATWANRKANGGLQVSYTKKTRPILQADSRVASFEFPAEFNHVPLQAPLG